MVGSISLSLELGMTCDIVGQQNVRKVTVCQSRVLPSSQNPAANFLTSPGVLVYCCCGKLPPTQWLIETHVYPLSVLEVSSLNWVQSALRQDPCLCLFQLVGAACFPWLVDSPASQSQQRCIFFILTSASPLYLLSLTLILLPSSHKVPCTDNAGPPR